MGDVLQCQVLNHCLNISAQALECVWWPQQACFCPVPNAVADEFAATKAWKFMSTSGHCAQSSRGYAILDGLNCDVICNIEIRCRLVIVVLCVSVYKYIAFSCCLLRSVCAVDTLLRLVLSASSMHLYLSMLYRSTACQTCTSAF